MKEFLKLLVIIIILFITSNSDVPDRDFYESQSLNALNSLYANLDSIKIIFQEPTWYLISHFLSLFGDVENTFRIFSQFLYLSNAFILSKIINQSWGKENIRSFFYKVIFIFSPSFIAMNLYHIRQGTGCLFFLLFVYYNLEKNNYFVKFKDFSFIYFLLAITTHLSYFFFIPFYIVSLIARKIKFNKVKLNLILFSTFIMSLPIINLAYSIRADKAEDLTQLSLSGLGFIFWLIWLLLLVHKPNSYKSYFSIIIISFYLFTYFRFHFVSRILQGFIPLIYIETKNMNANNFKIMGISLILLDFFGIYSIFIK